MTDVGMGDKGIVTLASLVQQDRLKQLNELCISGNVGITDQGINSLAQAIEARGLRRLITFLLKGFDTDRVTLAGIRVIAHAVAEKCPKCEEFIVEDDYQDAVNEKVLSSCGQRWHFITPARISFQQREVRR